MTAETTLCVRALNRALTDRQFLSRRTDRTPLEVIKRLVALQAQEPNWVYVGLWSRIHAFAHADLTAELENRQVVRSGLLRSTQHLATADDFRWLRPLLQPVLDRTAGSPALASSGGPDATTLVAQALDLLAGGTLPRRELARRLAEHHPEGDARMLAGQVELRTPLVHGPATAAWGSWGNRSAISVAAAEAWLGQPMVPATKASARELIDLAEAELPDPETPVPVRLLPAFDNALLGHADRRRIISDTDRKRVMPGRAQVLPTFLVDGWVHGTWSLEAGTLRLTPFRPLRESDLAALEQEADRLLPFVGGAVVSYS